MFKKKYLSTLYVIVFLLTKKGFFCTSLQLKGHKRLKKYIKKFAATIQTRDPGSGSRYLKLMDSCLGSVEEAVFWIWSRFDFALWIRISVDLICWIRIVLILVRIRNTGKCNKFVNCLTPDP